jgi:asparagine synthase (glutamine-hydrolysing)
MARRAAIGRVSFWALAFRNALLPLFPRILHSSLVHDQDEVPVLRWLEPATMRRYQLTTRLSSAGAYGGRLGHHYHDAVVASIAKLESPAQGGVIADSLDVRHPLLYRPLVEFALQLPPELSARPHAHRWVVREALRGILPETLRIRVGKPGTADVLTWSLAANRARLLPLLQDPVLGDLGIVNPTRLRAAFVAASSHERDAAALYAPLLSTLAVEAWLQLRSGRWPRGSHQRNCN